MATTPSMCCSSSPGGQLSPGSIPKPADPSMAPGSRTHSCVLALHKLLCSAEQLASEQGSRCPAFPPAKRGTD